jgi:hypothetical protein
MRDTKKALTYAMELLNENQRVKDVVESSMGLLRNQRFEVHLKAKNNFNCFLGRLFYSNSKGLHLSLCRTVASQRNCRFACKKIRNKHRFTKFGSYNNYSVCSMLLVFLRRHVGARF